MPTIVDVGARGGLHPRWQQSGWDVHGILFEPDPAAAEALRKEAATADSSSDLTVLETALSDKDETLMLNVLKFGGASSTYNLNYDEARRYYSDTSKFDVLERVALEARRLDDVLAENHIDHVDALKVDTQGSELAILQGSSKTLERTLCVEVEVEFRPIYENQPLFPEVNEFLSARGFELYDLGRCFRSRNECRDFGDRRGQLVWGDGLYFKSPERFLDTPDLLDAQILGGFQTYLIYGYPDSAVVLQTLACERGLVSAETKKAMDEGLATLRKAPFQRNASTRLRRMIHKVASAVVTALDEEHPHAFKRDPELGNLRQRS